jgi:hypothetical protein
MSETAVIRDFHFHSVGVPSQNDFMGECVRANRGCCRHINIVLYSLVEAMPGRINTFQRLRLRQARHRITRNIPKGGGRVRLDGNRSGVDEEDSLPRSHKSNIQNRPLIPCFQTQSHTPSGWTVTGDVNPGLKPGLSPVTRRAGKSDSRLRRSGTDCPTHYASR